MERILFRERPSLNKESNKEKLLKIGSSNVKNIETNGVYLRELYKECDILAVLEHWLFPFQLSSIEETFITHHAFSRAVDEDNPLPPNQNRGDLGVSPCCLGNIWISE